MPTFDIPVCFAGSHAQASGVGATNVVTVGTAFDGTPAAFPVMTGETIIVAGGAGTHLPTSITDTGVNSGYAQATGIATSPASWIWTAQAAHPLHAPGTGFSADTVTVTYPVTGDGKQAVVMSVPGLAASPVDSGSAATSSGSSLSPTVTSGTLAQAREFIVAVCCSQQSAGEAQWPAPWQVIAKSVQTGTTAYCSVAVLRNYSGTSAITVSPTLPGTSNTWTMSICGFKAATTANPLKNFVGSTVSSASFSDLSGSSPPFASAQEWDTDMGRAPCGQRMRVFYYAEGAYATSASSDPQGVISMCNSHSTMRPVVSLKPQRYGVVTPATATSEIAKICAHVTAYRNNQVPEARWCLWNEMNNGGGTSSFGDGTAKKTQSGDPWAVGGPVPPPQPNGWSGQQAGQHYQAYCNLYAPPLLLSGYVIAYKPMIPSWQSVQYSFPGAAWRTGAQANNTGGCNEIMLDIYAWDTHQDVVNKWIGTVTDPLAKGTLTNYQGTDYSFSPEMALGLGEVAVTDGPNTPDDANQQPGWTAKWFTNVSATSFSGHALPVPGLTQFFLTRMAGGHPTAPIVWFSENPAPAGNAIDSTGAINSRQDIGNAWRALFDALSVDAATTGTPPSITTTSPLPAGTVGAPYTFTMQATNGTAPLTWSITGGALPAGLSLASNGVISGTPTVAGTQTGIGILVTDAASLTGSGTFSMTVGSSQLTVPEQSLPGGTVSQAYSAMLVSHGGTGPYTWTALGAPGAYMGTTSMGVPDIPTGEAQWVASLARPLSARRHYNAAGDFTIPSSFTTDIANGTRICWTLRPAYNPTSATDLASINSALASLKAQGADIVVTLWHEPFFAGLTSTQYINMVQYYAATVRQYFPLAFVTAVSSVANNSENTYYPGDAYIDVVATDFYELDYRRGRDLTLASSIADAASPKKPFGLWEFNNNNINFLANPDANFEGGIGNWTNAGGCTIASSTGVVAANDGSSVLAMTATGVSNALAATCLASDILTKGIPCSPGDQPSVTAFFQAATVSRNCAVGAEFYNSSGTSLGQVFGTPVADSTTGFTQVTATPLAPATSARYRGLVRVASPGGAGEVHYVDTVTLFHAAEYNGFASGFFGYIQTFFTGRATAGKPNSDLLVFNDNGSGGLSRVITSSGDNRVPLLRTLFDAVNALPPGLALNANSGQITGVPATANKYLIGVQVTDHLGATAGQGLSILIGATGLFVIVTTSLPSGQTQSSYSAQLTTSGGVEPVTNWAIISGQLPPGLALAITAPADPHLLDESGAQVLDESGTAVTDETGP